ncbi:UNVERIFIED_CONTAM: EG45-like domain containing protein [Sesamum latifolium]|uniref:EG45-like domain containing protein n=1 Tax=Sesamum latifolium TaxID=2727402 RepID=A0AAW2XIG3_9LAMI
MAMERVIILALVASSLISMACAIPGTATFYTVYVRKFSSPHPSLETNDYTRNFHTWGEKRKQHGGRPCSIFVKTPPSKFTINGRRPMFAASACYGFEDRGTMIAAANPALYNNGAACGRRYRVRCTGPTNQGIPQPCRNGEITVTIVDLCPGCGADQLDLSQQAFSMIADPNAGRIRIDYNP